MPNAIKYNVSAQSLALKKGNFWIATGDVPKGTTVTTDYYNGITPPSGGYTIYLNKASQGPSIYVATNDANLIFITNKIAGTSYTTINECFTYYSVQTDKICLNKSYENIVTNGLVLNLDAGFVSSYPKNGTTWYDISGSNNGTLVNGSTFNSTNGECIVFDSVDDYVTVPYSSNLDLVNTISLEAWVKYTTTSNTVLIEKSNNNSHYQLQILNSSQAGIAGQLVFMLQPNSSNWVTSGVVTNDGNWHHVVGTYDRSSTTAKIYIDGILKNTNSSITTGPASNAQPLLIGSRSGLAGFGGSISNIKIYNRVLLSTEVLQNYYKGSIVTSGLIMALDAGNSVSYPGTGTSWKDLTTTGNNGTLVNGPTFNTGNGGIISFDGSNDYVSCGAFSVSYITVSTWVYRTSSATNQGICRKNNGWAVSQYNGALQVAPGTNWQFFNTGYTIPLNQWVNIVYTYSGTTQTVYINGSSIWSSSQAGALPSNGNGVNVGFDDNGWYWGGAIASTLIYNRELSAGEVKQNYEAHASRFI